MKVSKNTRRLRQARTVAPQSAGEVPLRRCSGRRLELVDADPLARLLAHEVEALAVGHRRHPARVDRRQDDGSVGDDLGEGRERERLQLHELDALAHLLELVHRPGHELLGQHDVVRIGFLGHAAPPVLLDDRRTQAGPAALRALDADWIRRGRQPFHGNEAHAPAGHVGRRRVEMPDVEGALPKSAGREGGEAGGAGLENRHAAPVDTTLRRRQPRRRSRALQASWSSTLPCGDLPATGSRRSIP